MYGDFNLDMTRRFCSLGVIVELEIHAQSFPTIGGGVVTQGSRVVRMHEPSPTNI